MAGKVSFPFKNFYNSNGKPLSNGYLLINVNTDSMATGGQVCCRNVSKILLDANGVIAGSPTFWPNAQMSPIGSYYVLRAYTDKGELVLGPASVVVTIQSNPFPPPSGQQIVWSTPLSVQSGGDGVHHNGSVSANLNGATISMNTIPNTGGYWVVQWSNFTVPTLPEGATINGIYPVVVASLVNNQTTPGNAGAWQFTSGYSDFNAFARGGPDHGNIDLINTGTPFSTRQFSSQNPAGSIGNTIAELQTMQMGGGVYQPAFSEYDQTMQIYYVALAVYYTS